MDEIFGLGFPQLVGATGLIASLVIAIGVVILVVKCYRKIEQGKAIVRNGIGGTKVSFSGIVVVPVIHRCEEIDISVKRIEIYRHGEDGLVCRDNIRADIKVVFFVRVNKTSDDVLRVAQSIGCVRASDQQALVELFDAKFSEALKTAGKQFDFTDLYGERERFKEEILKVVGTDLNGFVLDDAAIDYLEQTPLAKLDENNILDAEGIKKIIGLTAEQKILSNEIQQNKDKVITKENVEAREAILEMERQLAESEERQKREIANIKAREGAEALKVAEEERLKSEQARIASDQEIGISEENKDRQIIVAQKNKERTEAIETERLEKDRLLEATERERLVTLAQIDKEKTVETEKKNIQEVIRERVELEKTVVAEQERMKDVEAFAAADREKKVVVTRAEMTAEEALVRDIKAAEAGKKAAELKADEGKYQQVVAAQAAREASDLKAEELVILADAEEKAAEKESNAVKLRAEAKTADEAAEGMAEVSVTRARAGAIREQGEAEANVMQLKFSAEAKGIGEKADAMKEFDGVGREHEEFKLRLNKDKDIELAEIQVQHGIAKEQSKIVGAALESARIDIVGGDVTFFDKIVSSITQGKSIDRTTENSRVLTDVKETFFNGDPEYFKSQFKNWVQQFGLSSEDLKNTSISALLLKMIKESSDDTTKSTMQRALQLAKTSGLGEKLASEVLGVPVPTVKA
ncbi:MAG: flotillin family protein [Verrucomicrobia bacterium]|jgi:flotillin|nr:flotillin family protein [Verrucomicrobiota bacterium]